MDVAGDAAALNAQRPAIAHDIEIGHNLNVQGTPVYFINGVKLTTGGSLPKVEEVDWAIRLELARTLKSKKP